MPLARGRRKHTMNREPGDLPYTVKMSLRKEGFFGYITQRAFLFFFSVKFKNLIIMGIVMEVNNAFIRGSFTENFSSKF